jgi:hypothetical protein
MPPKQGGIIRFINESTEKAAASRKKGKCAPSDYPDCKHEAAKKGQLREEVCVGVWATPTHTDPPCSSRVGFSVLSRMKALNS